MGKSGTTRLPSMNTWWEEKDWNIFVIAGKLEEIQGSGKQKEKFLGSLETWRNTEKMTYYYHIVKKGLRGIEKYDDQRRGAWHLMMMSLNLVSTTHPGPLVCVCVYGIFIEDSAAGEGNEPGGVWFLKEMCELGKWEGLGRVNSPWRLLSRGCK